MRPIITLTTDFSWSVAPGICRGVIKRICPEADIVDITHSIPHYDLETGALMMLDAIAYLPTAIHVVVVDPGVGSVRRPVAIKAGRGDILIAPDNGVLMAAVDLIGGPVAAREITSPDVILLPTSATFHGRDIFSPAAAHLAGGMPFDALGPAIPVGSLTRLDLPAAQLKDGLIAGLLLRFDPFGSARTNITGELVDRAGLTPGDLVSITLGDRTLLLPLVTTFSDVAVGDACCLVDSSGNLEIAINQGSTRESLNLVPRMPLRVSRMPQQVYGKGVQS